MLSSKCSARCLLQRKGGGQMGFPGEGIEFLKITSNFSPQSSIFFLRWWCPLAQAHLTFCTGVETTASCSLIFEDFLTLSSTHPMTLPQCWRWQVEKTWGFWSCAPSLKDLIWPMKLLAACYAAFPTYDYLPWVSMTSVHKKACPLPFGLLLFRRCVH